MHSEPSSREASEEPQHFEPSSGRATPDTLGRISLDTADSPTDDRKQRRRFSSPFHRPSRSRSRPNSIAISSLEGTPRGTPLAPNGRPQSYHAPEIWNMMPGELDASPPAASVKGQERLGVLPSPAKSAFSFLQQDGERNGEVPPVPPIPGP